MPKIRACVRVPCHHKNLQACSLLHSVANLGANQSGRSSIASIVWLLTIALGIMVSVDALGSAGGAALGKVVGTVKS